MIQGCKRSRRDAKAALAVVLCDLRCSQISSKLVTGGCFSSSPMNSPLKEHCLRGLSLLSPCPAHGTSLYPMILHHCAVCSFPVMDICFSF